MFLSLLFASASFVRAQIFHPPLSSFSPAAADIVVAQDGSGNFSTVQAAFDALPDGGGDWTVVLIKKGLYKEKLFLNRSKQKVVLLGEEVDSVVLTYDDFSGRVVEGDTLTTGTSQTLRTEADDVIMKDLTIQNSAGQVGQAVAVRVTADRVQFVGCRLKGNQDTFYTSGRGRIYLKDCTIEGTTDFIFGSSIAVFDRCFVYSKKNSYITAASTPEGNCYGYVFFGCRLAAADTVTRVYLGRPWRPHARTVFIRCELGGHIVPEGWHNWSKPDAEKTLFYAEYQCTGPGSSTAQRVQWSKQLDSPEADLYTPKNIFARDAAAETFADDWLPTSD